MHRDWVRRWHEATGNLPISNQKTRAKGKWTVSDRSWMKRWESLTGKLPENIPHGRIKCASNHVAESNTVRHDARSAESLKYKQTYAEREAVRKYWHN